MSTKFVDVDLSDVDLSDVDLSDKERRSLISENITVVCDDDYYDDMPLIYKILSCFMCVKIDIDDD